MNYPLKLRTWILSTIFALSPLAIAQIIPSQATHEEVDHWLRSGDPRLVACGAAFAARNADRDELPFLVRLAERYEALPPQRIDERGNYVPISPEQQSQFDSMQAVIDALIQLHGTVTPHAVEELLADFPAQSIILFATMPEPERSQYALTIYGTRDTSDQPYDWHRLAKQQMIHVAAAILALDPPPGFTATLIHETTVHLKVAVSSDDRLRDGAFATATCGDSFNLTAAPGWPQPHTYVVEQHWPNQGLAEGVLVQEFPPSRGVARLTAVPALRYPASQVCRSFSWQSKRRVN